MADAVPLKQAEDRLGELVSRARYEHERVLLSENGVPVAAIISIADLDELQRAKDAEDLALCQAIKASPGTGRDQFPDQDPYLPISPRKSQRVTGA